jgi:hypothetical protein
MHIYDLPNNEEVKVSINGEVYELKLLERERDTEDDEYNLRCDEWCAMRDLCTETAPKRAYCAPYNSMYLGYGDEYTHNKELTFQLSDNL